MGRLCERPGCSEVAAIAFGFDVDQLLVWLAARHPTETRCAPARSAAAMPTRWSCRGGGRSTIAASATPRLFRSAPADPSAPRARTKRRPPADPPADQLVLEADERTVADVAGAHDSDDPDATEAIPWMPDFDQQDDLGGVLAARSPLLARVFRGTDRPR